MYKRIRRERGSNLYLFRRKEGEGTEQQRRIKLKIKEGGKKIKKDDQFFKYKSAVAKEKRYF